MRPAEQTARTIEVRAVLRHFVPYKGLHPLRHRRRKVRSSPFPPCGENCAHSLAPPLPTKSCDFAGNPYGYPGALRSGNNLLTQTVPAAKSENPIPSTKPSTENVGGLFHPIHPIKKEVMYYAETENHPGTESRDR